MLLDQNVSQSEDGVPETLVPEKIAAIDLGSNSFHIVIARLVHGEIRVLEKMGEKVQLGAGLDDTGRISEEAQERALACLGRFAQMIKGMPAGSVRVVGTNALRAAKNARQFTNKAAQTLGIPIEIIAGREEARLIYLGVSHTLSDDQGKRLVIDIGGGSTECIIGERFEARELESLYMGCVSYRNRFFASGDITRVAFDKAVTAASLEILSIREAYLRSGWQDAVGSSGSVKAIANVLSHTGIVAEGITWQGLKELRERVIDAGHVDKLEPLGVRKDRASVFVPGLAILYAAFEVLGIDVMEYSDGALREGVLYDMVGRIQHEDVRERTIVALAERYHVDQTHAQSIERCVMLLYREVRKSWGLVAPFYAELLRWAARIHEIGLTISHSQYHKHGAYLLEYSDLPGFSKQVQKALAVLVRCHRRKISPLVFEGYSEEELEPLLRLCVLLRLAVILQHGRVGEIPESLKLRAEKRTVDIHFDEQWLQAHPLTLADLAAEAEYLLKMGVTLQINPQTSNTPS